MPRNLIKSVRVLQKLLSLDARGFSKMTLFSLSEATHPSRFPFCSFFFACKGIPAKLIQWLNDPFHTSYPLLNFFRQKIILNYVKVVWWKKNPVPAFKLALWIHLRSKFLLLLQVGKKCILSVVRKCAKLARKDHSCIIYRIFVSYLEKKSTKNDA